MLLILEKNGDQTLVPVDMERVKEMVGVESKHICDEMECFCDQLSKADAILYLDSFEVPFEEVERRAEAKWRCPQVLRIHEKDGTYMVEYRGISSCDVTADEVPDAIGNLLYIQDQELIERRRLFNCLALVVILITIFLHIHTGIEAHSTEGVVVGSQVENGS